MEKNELMLHCSYELSNGQKVDLNEPIIRNLTNNNKFINQGEISLFLSICQSRKVNPLIGEAYIIKYDNSRPAQMVVSYQAIIRIADENPNYDGMEDGIIVKRGNEIIDKEGCIVYPNETLIGGWAKVYRKDRTRPTIVRLDIKEYSKGQATWTNMPATMINKCAKVNALKKAFPSQLSGCDTQETIIEQPMEEKPTQEVFSVDDVMENSTAEPTNIETTAKEVVLDTLPDIEPAEVFNADNNDDEGWTSVDYSVYKNNTDKYEKKPDSYDRTSHTILVRPKEA